MQTILRHMQGLQRSIEGDELYALIARVLRKYNRLGPIGIACFTELYRELEAYARDPIALPSTRIKAKLLQQHILPHLQDGDQTTRPQSAAAYSPSPQASEVSIDSVAHVIPAGAGGQEAGNETVKEATRDNRGPTPGDPHQRYDMLRRSEQDAWRAIYDAVKDISALKKLWANRLEELANERDQLELRLTETERTLKTAEANHDQLRAKLEDSPRAAGRKAARRLTKLTRLAAPRLLTRELFVQQLQSEISRVKRSGGAAALALLGIDDLPAIKQKYGADAETGVFECYAREILSSFRAYDIVGHHHADGFAVLFPDTQQDGAVRALEKAQKRAAETHVCREGHRFPLPGFYGALTVYSAGDEVAAWLQRAEESLTSARAQKGVRLVVS